MNRTHGILATSVLLLILFTANSAYADQNGHFTVSASGLPITGDLTNELIHDGSVTMTMVINQYVPTRLGPVHVTGDGIWTGTQSNSTLSGTIENVKGDAQACFLIFCQEATFTGTGTWTGTLNDAGSGSGSLQGTLTFNGSPLAPSGPVPISGTWEATF
jgi:hypothetical protein